MATTPDQGLDDFVRDEALRGLERQAKILGELRGRASIVLSATGIVASVLGRSALEDGHRHVVLYGGLAITALGIILCVWVLKPVRDRGPRRDWRVTLSPEQIEELRAGTITMDDVIDIFLDARRLNHGTLHFRSIIFVVACALLPLQIVVWALSLLYT